MGGRFSHDPETCPQALSSPCNDHARHKYIDKILESESIAEESENRFCVDQGQIEEIIPGRCIDLREYVDQFPFENLVFEGGGAKGIAYPGALLALEELGLMSKIKRFSGASVGSIVALMAALGYSSHEILQVLQRDFKMFFDARLGRLSVIPNLLRYFGWQPMNKFYEFLGELVENKLSDKDATFSDFYKNTGKELCIVVTNINYMEEEYFHPKTTPDVPIRMAVRMSTSIPGMTQPVHYTKSGCKCVYVDGGLLVNYPVSCFDGWWLSMKKEDSFYKRLQPLDSLPSIMNRRNRFARNEKTAEKTLGFILYAKDEEQSFKAVFESRRNTTTVYPDTKLGRKAMQTMKNETKLGTEHLRVKSAINKFLKLASKYDINSDEMISADELEEILNDETFTQCDKDRLFGKDVTVEDVMKQLDKDGNGKIAFEELVVFIEEMGLTIANRNMGFKRQEVTTLLNFMQTLYTTLSFGINEIGFSVQEGNCSQSHQEKMPSFMHIDHPYTSSSRKSCRGTTTGKTPNQAAQKAPMEKMPSFMNVDHPYVSSNRKRCRGTPTGKTPIQASKKAQMSSRWSDEERNYVTSFAQKKITDHPISNEYWKKCAHDMNADLGTNRTGASCKSFYRRFLASDTLHSDVDNEILATPLEQETDRYCQTDLSFPVMRTTFTQPTEAMNDSDTWSEESRTPQSVLRCAFNETRPSETEIYSSFQGKDLLRLVTLLFCSDNVTDICRAILEVKVFKKCLWKLFLEDICENTKYMCIKGHSYLSQIDFESLRCFQWENLLEEMYLHQRQLLQVLLTVCTSNNKSEDDQHFLHVGKEVGLVYGILMKRRCNTLSRVQRVVSISLADERVHQKSDDLPRTVGINTHYIGTLELNYQKEDVDFLNRESYQSTMAFLKNFVATKLLAKDETRGDLAK